ncbi:MAG: hydroxyacid dehydrogenase [Glaciihabitans sp.]|nr:hydroxyacid dehydrogenase [Glaciihabitans sp.]
MKIAFLGLGRMGRELVTHVQGAGHSVTVWNRTPQAAESAVEAGATLAPTAAEAVRDADVVLSVLFGPDTVREVITGGELPFASGALWIDITTVSPADATEFDAFAKANGIRYVHSPVIGSLAPARAAKLGVLIGGDAAAVTDATPLVSLWADPEKIRTFSSAAGAAVGKLIANLALATATQGVLEALRLGHSVGVATDDVLSLLALTPLGAMAGVKGPAIQANSFDDAQFSVNALSKDTLLMLHTSRFALPSVTAMADGLDRLKRAGHGEWDFSAVASERAS